MTINMAPIVIPHAAYKEDLVLIPKSEYEEYLALKKMTSDTIIFDASRDNRGKGIKAKNLLQLLKKVNRT